MTREDIEKCFAYNCADKGLEYYEKFIDKQVKPGDIYDAFEAGQWAQEFIIRACGGF